MKKRNLLLSSLALLVVAIVGFAGATYAWFVSGIAPNVSQLDVQVMNVGRIRIGVKGDDYLGGGAAIPRAERDFIYTLPIATLRSANGVNGYYHNPNEAPTEEALNAITPQVATPADPVTKTLVFAPDANGIDRLQFKGQDTVTGAYDGAPDTSNFIGFDLYFKNMGSEGNPGATPAVPADSSYYIAFNATDSKFWVENTYSFMALPTTAAQKAITASLRVAFVTFKWDDTNAGIDPNNRGIEVIDRVQVWAPETQSITTLTGGNIPQMTDGGIIQNISVNEATYMVNATSADTTFNVDYIPLFTLAPSGTDYQSEKILRLSIYVWIEGNDRDCVSLAAGGGFSSLFQFTQTEVV